MGGSRIVLIVGVVFTIVGLGLIAVGWRDAHQQRERLATFVPIEARVVESSINTIHGDKGNVSYEPVIGYRYKVNGQQFTSHQFQTVSGYSSGNYSYASGICAKYPVGARTTAYRSPVDPSIAFLIHQATFAPHLLILMGSICASVGTCLLVAGFYGSRKPLPPMGQADGWFALHETTTTTRRFITALMACVIWGVFAAATLVDYYTVNGRHFDLFCQIAASACGMVLLILAGIAAWFWRLQHDFRDCQIAIRNQYIRPGDTLCLRLRQSLLRPLSIKEIAVGAICTRFDRIRSGSSIQYTNNEEWSFWQPLVKEHNYDTASQIEGETTVQIPADSHPTGPLPGKAYPNFRWHIALKIQAHGQPTLHLKFPVTVKPAVDQGVA